jgi:hypothetical protein
MPAMLSIAALRPPFGVHQSGPPSRRPAVRCPARPVSGHPAPSSGRGCPASWCPARPASSRLVSARSQPSRPASASGGDGGHLGTAVTTGSSRVPCGPAPTLAARSTARGMDAGTAAEVVWRPAGSVGRGPEPGWCVGGRLRPTDQAGQTAARGALSLAIALGQGELAGARGCRTAPWAGHLSWSRDYAAWSLPSLTSEWTGPERLKRVRRRGWRAAPTRPSQVASAIGSTLATL